MFTKKTLTKSLMKSDQLDNAYPHALDGYNKKQMETIENTDKSVYIIFSQHYTSPITPSKTGSIKGFETTLENARTTAKQIIEREYKQDQTNIHCAIIRYELGALESALWTINHPGHVFKDKRHTLMGGYLKTRDELKTLDTNFINIDDLNSRTRGIDNKKCVIC
jgi:hypothetical protein